jgi:hypothetical protein
MPNISEATLAAWLASPYPSPITITEVGSEVALKLVGGPNVSQIFEIFDRFGNPIFTVPTVGGPAVLGDRISAFRPGDVFNADWRTLTGSTDNVVTNAAGFRLGHGTVLNTIIAVGVGLPTAANPISSGMPPDGSIFIRTDGAVGATIYQARSGAWVATAA